MAGPLAGSPPVAAPRRPVRGHTLLAVFAISAVVYAQYGFEGTITRDAANALYAGQQMARGVPPYVSMFNHSGALGPFTAGAGVWLASSLGRDEVGTVRLVFLVLGALAPVAVCLLAAALFDSAPIGLLAAATFLGFGCFGEHAVTSATGKIPMVALQALALVSMVHGRWFWAGLFGSLAFVAWQPMLVFAGLAVGLAAARAAPGRERARHLTSALAGVAIPVVLVVAYFLSHGALGDLVDATILFNLVHLEREPSSIAAHLMAPIAAVYRSYSIMAVPIALGFLAVCLMYGQRVAQGRGRLRRLVAADRFAPILLSFPAPVVWSLLDFQGCPDLYVLLPYVAIGFGWWSWLAFQGAADAGKFGPAARRVCFAALCGTLVATSAAYYRRASETGLREQRQWARALESRFGPDVRLVSIGAPGLLVLLNRTNPNPYPFIVSGIDNRIDATTPGGFDGWLSELEAYNPEVIAFGPTSGRFAHKLLEWLHASYQESAMGPWTVFVRKHAGRAFGPGAAGGPGGPPHVRRLQS